MAAAHADILVVAILAEDLGLFNVTEMRRCYRQSRLVNMSILSLWRNPLNEDMPIIVISLL